MPWGWPLETWNHNFHWESKSMTTFYLLGLRIKATQKRCCKCQWNQFCGKLGLPSFLHGDFSIGLAQAQAKDPPIIQFTLHIDQTCWKEPVMVLRHKPAYKGPESGIFVHHSKYLPSMGIRTEGLAICRWAIQHQVSTKQQLTGLLCCLMAPPDTTTRHNSIYCGRPLLL